jgi:hypothetical protein
VYRPEIGKALLCEDDSSIVAVATKTPIDVKIPNLNLDDIDAVTDFILSFCGFTEERKHGAA